MLSSSTGVRKTTTYIQVLLLITILVVRSATRPNPRNVINQNHAGWQGFSVMRKFYPEFSGFFMVTICSSTCLQLLPWMWKPLYLLRLS